MNIYFGSDHAGFDLKEKIKTYLKDQSDFFKNNIRIYDYGCFSKHAADYPYYAHKVIKQIKIKYEQTESVNDNDSFGILVCGTGIGMAMAANKYRNIRASVGNNKESVVMARKHNNSNILCLGGSNSKESAVIELVNLFTSTKFDGDDRHCRRIELMDMISDVKK